MSCTITSQLTSGTCDPSPSLHYTECDASHLVCLSTSGCWRSPSCRRPTWMSCQFHLRRHKTHVRVLVLQSECSNLDFLYTCIILLFITNTEDGLDATVRFADAVAAAHVPADGRQIDNSSISEELEDTLTPNRNQTQTEMAWRAPACS